MYLFAIWINFLNKFKQKCPNQFTNKQIKNTANNKWAFKNEVHQVKASVKRSKATVIYLQNICKHPQSRQTRDKTINTHLIQCQGTKILWRSLKLFDHMERCQKSSNFTHQATNILAKNRHTNAPQTQ